METEVEIEVETKGETGGVESETGLETGVATKYVTGMSNTKLIELNAGVQALLFFGNMVL